MREKINQLRFFGFWFCCWHWRFSQGNKREEKALGIDTLGGWGHEAINFMKHICNKFPPDISCRLKYKWKMFISTFIKRGQRYSTEKVKHQLSYCKEALPFPVME